MYWTHSPKRSDLEGGRVFVQGLARLNLSAFDLRTFVEPADAALVFGFRTLEDNDSVEKGWPVWMATLRRRSGDEAIVECVQRVFTQIADQGSLVELLAGICDRARALGYRKVWFGLGLLKEEMFGPALKQLTDELGCPVELQAGAGLFGLAV